MGFNVVIHLAKTLKSSSELERIVGVFSSSPMIGQLWHNSPKDIPAYIFLSLKENRDRAHSQAVDEIKSLIKKADPTGKWIEQYEFQLNEEPPL